MLPTTQVQLWIADLEATAVAAAVNIIFKKLNRLVTTWTDHIKNILKGPKLTVLSRALHSGV